MCQSDMRSQQECYLAYSTVTSLQVFTLQCETQKVYQLYHSNECGHGKETTETLNGWDSFEYEM